jgi:hypothetical protein
VDHRCVLRWNVPRRHQRRFPTQLFLTLTGVTLLFTLAEVNGALGKLAFRAVRSCRGNAGVIPIMFFVLAFIFGSIGPGSIASIALLGPMAIWQWLARPASHRS